MYLRRRSATTHSTACVRWRGGGVRVAEATGKEKREEEEEDFLGRGEAIHF